MLQPMMGFENTRFREVVDIAEKGQAFRSRWEGFTGGMTETEAGIDSVNDLSGDDAKEEGE